MKQMKHLKKLFLSISFLSMLNFYSFNNIYASNFNDVQEDHWAYDYIQNMSQLGILVGDLSGNFNPDSYISKFDALKIIATLYGYNSNTKNEDEKEYYKILNYKYKDLFAKYEVKYSKWNSAVSYEMAYLLENSILKEDELEQFIVLNDGNQQLRALSKEELAVFLVRTMNLEDEVSKMQFEYTFKDHSNIAIDKVNSVYYLNSLNIITAENDQFLPKSAVTKADISFIITKFLEYTNINISLDNYQTEFDGNTLYTQFVTIEKVYPLWNLIQIRDGYRTNIYKIDDSNIKIDEIQVSIDLIEEGSYAEVTFNNSSIISINIDTNITDNSVLEYSLYDNVKKGVIKSISADSIAISYNNINEDGFLGKEIIDIIYFNKNCKIIKNNDFIGFDHLTQGDIISIKLLNDTASEIYVEDKNSLYIGELLGKSKNYIIIKFSDENVLKLQLCEEYEIIRNGELCNIDDLGVGDMLTIETSQNLVSKIIALGQDEHKQGIITSIKIYETYSTITLQDLNNLDDLTTYYLSNDGQIDIYSIRVLDKVSLVIKTNQINSLTLIERNNKTIALNS